MAWSKEMICRNFEVCHALSRCHAKRVGLESPFLERFFRYQLSNIGCERDIVTTVNGKKKPLYTFLVSDGSHDTHSCSRRPAAYVHR